MCTSIDILQLVQIVGANTTLIDRTNNAQSYKPGPGLPKDIIYKIRPKIGIKKRHLKSET